MGEHDLDVQETKLAQDWQSLAHALYATQRLVEEQTSIIQGLLAERRVEAAQASEALAILNRQFAEHRRIVEQQLAHMAEGEQRQAEELERLRRAFGLSVPLVEPVQSVAEH